MEEDIKKIINTGIQEIKEQQRILQKQIDEFNTKAEESTTSGKPISALNEVITLKESAAFPLVQDSTTSKANAMTLKRFTKEIKEFKETEFDLSTLVADGSGDFILDCTTIEGGTTHLTLIFSTEPNAGDDYEINNVLQTDITVIRCKPTIESLDWKVSGVFISIDCLQYYNYIYYHKNIKVQSATSYLIPMPLYEYMYSLYFDMTKFKLTNNTKDYIYYHIESVEFPVTQLGVIEDENDIYISNDMQGQLICINQDIAVKEAPIFHFRSAVIATYDYSKPYNIWDFSEDWSQLLNKIKNLKNAEYCIKREVDETNHYLFFYDKVNNFTMAGELSEYYYSLYNNTFYLDTNFTIKAGWFIANVTHLENDGVSLLI